MVSVAWLALGADLPEPRAGSDAAGARWTEVDEALEQGLAFDHAQILRDGVERAGARLEYSALATAFCAPEFTVGELRAVYEAVWGQGLDPRNFHRKVTSAQDFLVETGERTTRGGGRPARLYVAGRPGSCTRRCCGGTRPSGIMTLVDRCGYRRTKPPPCPGQRSRSLAR